MRAWVDHVATLAGERRLWDHGFQYGDWLDPSAPPHRPGAAHTAPDLVATAYFARSAELLGRAAAVLGREAEAVTYQHLADEVRAAFVREYVTPAGRVASDSTTAYSLAIEFGLLRDPEQRRVAGRRLATLARESGFRISTGFVGTPLICDALCSACEYDVAFHLLTQTACPSWLYPVTMGATTIWERWDSMLPDGTVKPGEMTSFNHYALGAIADWLHRTVAGLAPGAPGYRRLEIRPQPGGGLTYACARHRTPYGMAEAGWRIETGQMEVEIVVPPNTTAQVTLPRPNGYDGEGAEALEVSAGTHRWSYAWPSNTAPALSLDSTVGDLLDTPNAWAAVSYAVPRLVRNEVRLRRQRALTLREVAATLPNAERSLALIEAAITEFN